MQDEKIKSEIKKEVHKEFALERMILFSDAVFAIVITLMAIEIQLPHSEKSMNLGEMKHALLHLIPIILSYAISFTFVGVIWHQHLKIFSLIRSFDEGLVARNLFLLFFVGLFPFTSTLVSRGPKNEFIPIMIYILVIMVCIFCISLIEHYIFYKKPHLRNHIDATKQIEKHNERKLTLTTFIIIMPIIIVWSFFNTNPDLKYVPNLLLCLLPLCSIAINFYTKRKNKKKLSN